MWEKAAGEEWPKPTLMTWDTTPTRPSSFLSHNQRLFPAAQRKVLAIPKLVWELDAGEVVEELQLVARGYSGRIWVWGEEEARFGLKRDGEVWVKGYSVGASASLIERFVTAGMLLRRLDSVPLQLLTHPDPAYHAFSHALRQVLSHVRQSLQGDSLEADSKHVGLVALHASLSSVYHILLSIASLLSLGPSYTPPFPPLPPNLLKLVYSTLNRSISHSSPPEVQCVLAWVWDQISRPALHVLELSLGLGRAALGGEDDTTGLAELDGVLGPNVRKTLESGRRSLELLRKAAPGHVLCGTASSEDERGVKWVWTDDEVASVQEEADNCAEELRLEVKQWKAGIVLPKKMLPVVPTSSKPKIAPAVLTDDSDPFDIPLTLPSPISAPNAFTAFLSTHPTLSPTLAPTLALLTSTSLSPLLSRSLSLSLALLDVLLPSLLSHLHTIHAFFHLRSYKFVSLLGSALFVHPSPEVAHARGTRARVRARVGIRDDAPREGKEEGGREWAAVGLGVGMTERGAWPPGGAELGFVLRRVVLDSMEREEGTEVESGEREVKERVGFVIQELEEGDDTWLDPLRIEALDFLELQYKVPQSLEVVFDPQSMYKHQRIFSFLLRLLRVDIVVRDMYIPAQHQSLFPSSPASTFLLRLTCFKAQAFVSTVVSYVYDTAIGGPWSSFLARLRRLSASSPFNSPPLASQRKEYEAELRDVFALAAYHHSVLDVMLEGCFLRSGQAKPKQALMECLGTVLVLGQMMLDLRRGTVTEGRAEEQLRELARELDEQIRELVQVLKAAQGTDAGAQRGRNESMTANGADLWLRLNIHGYY